MKEGVWFMTGKKMALLTVFGGWAVVFLAGLIFVDSYSAWFYSFGAVGFIFAPIAIGMYVGRDLNRNPVPYMVLAFFAPVLSWIVVVGLDKKQPEPPSMFTEATQSEEQIHGGGW